MRTQKQNRKETDQKAVSITVHFKELRKRLITTFVAFLLCFLICFNFAADLVQFLSQMAIEYGYQLIYLAPTELFGQYIKVALIVSVSTVMPLLIFQIFAFCKPGLKEKEKKYFLQTILSGFGCFIIGLIFAFYIILPFMLRFFIEISNDSIIQASISISNYVNFIISILLMFGIIFEMPVVVTLLTRLHLVNPKFLKRIRKLVIVLIFIICAIITPPDIISQIMVAIPMILLYEASIQISSMLYRKKKQQ